MDNKTSGGNTKQGKRKRTPSSQQGRPTRTAAAGWWFMNFLNPFRYLGKTKKRPRPKSTPTTSATSSNLSQRSSQQQTKRRKAAMEGEANRREAELKAEAQAAAEARSQQQEAAQAKEKGEGTGTGQKRLRPKSTPPAPAAPAPAPAPAPAAALTPPPPSPQKRQRLQKSQKRRPPTQAEKKEAFNSIKNIAGERNKVELFRKILQIFDSLHDFSDIFNYDVSLIDKILYDNNISEEEDIKKNIKNIFTSSFEKQLLNKLIDKDVRREATDVPNYKIIEIMEEAETEGVIADANSFFNKEIYCRKDLKKYAPYYSIATQHDFKGTDKCSNTKNKEKDCYNCNIKNTDEIEVNKTSDGLLIIDQVKLKDGSEDSRYLKYKLLGDNEWYFYNTSHPSKLGMPKFIAICKAILEEGEGKTRQLPSPEQAVSTSLITSNLTDKLKSDVNKRINEIEEELTEMRRRRISEGRRIFTKIEMDKMKTLLDERNELTKIIQEELKDTATSRSELEELEKELADTATSRQKQNNRGGGKRIRGGAIQEINIPEIKEIISTLYQLDITNFKDNDQEKININYIRSLLDIKRLGDLLQIKVAQHNDYLFITGDQMAFIISTLGYGTQALWGIGRKGKIISSKKIRNAIRGGNDKSFTKEEIDSSYNETLTKLINNIPRDNGKVGDNTVLAFEFMFVADIFLSIHEHLSKKVASAPAAITASQSSKISSKKSSKKVASAPAAITASQSSKKVASPPAAITTSQSRNQAPAQQVPQQSQSSEKATRSSAPAATRSRTNNKTTSSSNTTREVGREGESSSSVTQIIQR